MQWLDRFFEDRARDVAKRTSRRSALARLGRVVAGTAVALPILPFDRVGNHALAQHHDHVRPAERV